MKDVSASIGRKITTLRKRRGFSLSKLAEIAGISKSTLSAIESGKINPTISTLWAIANALNVPFGELLPDELMEVNESGMTVRLIERSIGKPKVEVYKMVLGPMCVRKAEPHQKGVVEKIFVVSGSMISGPLSSPKLLKAGDEFEFRADVPHIYIATDEGAIAIVTIIYPVDDVRCDLARPFPKSDTDFESLLIKLKNEILSGVLAFKIELYGDYTEEDLGRLKETLNRVKMKNLKLWLVEREDRVEMYVFNILREIRVPKDVDKDAVRILKLARRRSLSDGELKYLQNVVDCKSNLLSVLASEVLLIHGYPKVPKVGLVNPKILRPGYARQVLFVASAVRKYVKNDKIQAEIVGDQTQARMLYELMPSLEENLSDTLMISFNSDISVLEKAEESLGDGGILIVSGDFLSPYNDRLERLRNAVVHHTRLMLETLVEIPASLTDEERKLVDLLSANLPQIHYLAEVGEVERAFGYAYRLYKDLSKTSVRVTDPLVAYYIFQRLELIEMIESINVKTYPAMFRSLAEDMGFSLLYHERIHATHGMSEMDAGIHIFVLKREG